MRFLLAISPSLVLPFHRYLLEQRKNICINAYTTLFKPVILPPDQKIMFFIWNIWELPIATTHWIHWWVQVNFILLGSFLLAFAIEEVGLHHRLALKLLSMVPGDPKALGNRWWPREKG